MPCTNILLSQLGEARFVSALGLTKGCWQVHLRAQDKKKTTFATPKGLYQFKLMPFSLHGAAATFQRLVITVLGPCEGFTLAYLDDILVCSRIWSQHLHLPEQVFQHLQDAGLRINPPKSKMGFIQLNYLGYMIGGGQVKPKLNKISAIQHTPQPRTKKQLRHFLELAGYYSRFISCFADIASLLTDRLSKGQPHKILRDTNAVQALLHLKQALCSGLVLHNPNFTQAFLLQTDASNKALEAVLLQEYPNREHPVVYLSRNAGIPPLKGKCWP